MRFFSSTSPLFSLAPPFVASLKSASKKFSKKLQKAEKSAGVAGELPGRPAADRRRPAVWIGRSAAPDPAPAGRGAGGCEHEPDLNRATEAELTCLPGIGKVLAGRIVAERAAHGPFR